MRLFKAPPVVSFQYLGPGDVQRRTKRQQPHPPETVEKVRRLVEGTPLTFRQIRAQTGVDNGTISRWAEAKGWTRPRGAWPSARKPGRRWVRAEIGRVLAQRLRVQAERLIVEIERAPSVSPRKLKEALDLLARARAEHRVRRTHLLVPPKPDPDADFDFDSAEALGAGPPVHRRKRSRHDRAAAAVKGWTKRYANRARHHAWMLEKE